MFLNLDKKGSFTFTPLYKLILKGLSFIIDVLIPHNIDIKHTQYAYNLLNPGGRLVAIMSESPFFRMDKEAVAFRNWLDEVNGSSEKLPQGSFLDSERSTGVATRIVVIDKPNANPGNTNFNQNLSDQAKELTPEPIQNVSTLPEVVELDSPKELIENQENTTSISTLVTKNLTEEKHFDGILDTDEYQALKDNFLEHQQTYQMIMMDALLPIGQDIKYVYHAYSLLDIGGSLVAKMPQTTFAPSNRAYAEFRRWLKSINATTTKLPEDNVCLVYVTKNTLF